MTGAERKRRLADAAAAIAFVGKVCEVLSELIANDRLNTSIQKVLTEAEVRLHRTKPPKKPSVVMATIDDD
jgi:S-adenosylmethionine synthetase